MNNSKVICIGEALIDRIVSASGKESIDYLGGAPANVASALSKLEIQSSFIGNVGDDTYGLKFLELFKKLEIDISVFEIDKKFKTRIVKVLRDKDGDRSFVGFEGNKHDFYADEVLDRSVLKNKIHSLERLYSKSKFIITGTIMLASVKSAEAIYFLLNYAKNFKLKIVIDLNWRQVFWENSTSMKIIKREDQIKQIIDYLKFADIIKLSKEEADMFFGNSNPLKISKNFNKSPDVVITNGGSPVNWFINGYVGISDIRHSGKIIDTTGAGDSFLAGLISKLVNSKKSMNNFEIQKAIQFASACGYLTCKGEGAIEAQPNLKDVKEFLHF